MSVRIEIFKIYYTLFTYTQFYTNSIIFVWLYSEFNQQKKVKYLIETS